MLCLRSKIRKSHTNRKLLTGNLYSAIFRIHEQKFLMILYHVIAIFKFLREYEVEYVFYDVVDGDG